MTKYLNRKPLYEERRYSITEKILLALMGIISGSVIFFVYQYIMQ